MAQLTEGPTMGIGSRTLALVTDAEVGNAVKLAKLAEVINTEHALVIGAGETMIGHAISCGLALLEAREEIETGDWLQWMKDNINVSVWTAHRYMRIARHRDDLKGHDVAYIEDAMRILADKPRLGHGPRKYSTADRLEMLAIYEEHGMAVTMEAFGCAKSTVWRTVSKNSPDRFDPNAPPKEVNDESIEAMARWLVESFGGEAFGSDDEFPVRITSEVRAAAMDALTYAFTPPDESHLSHEDKVNRALMLYMMTDQSLSQIGARFGVAGNTILRWCEPDAAERARIASQRWKADHRERNRAYNREYEYRRRNGNGSEDGPNTTVTVITEAPFYRFLREQGKTPV